jgi:hypothetical protein
MLIAMFSEVEENTSLEVLISSEPSDLRATVDIKELDLRKNGWKGECIRFNAGSAQPYCPLELQTAVHALRKRKLHRTESGLLDLTISDATIYDNVTQINSHGPFAPRAKNVLAGLSDATSNLQDVAQPMQGLLDNFQGFVALVDQISLVSRGVLSLVCNL